MLFILNILNKKRCNWPTFVSIHVCDRHSRILKPSQYTCIAGIAFFFSVLSSS